MDKLNTWRRARLVYVTKRYKRRDTETEIDAQLFYTKKIDALFSSLPQNMVADAAFNAKSHARALLNYERILYGLGSKKPVSQLQNYYERLHNIYAELNEPDGMEGVSVSIISPSLEHQIREHEMTGRWTSAQSCWEVQLQLEPENPASHLGLLRCLRNLGHYGKLGQIVLPICTDKPFHRLSQDPYCRFASGTRQLARCFVPIRARKCIDLWRCGSHFISPAACESKLSGSGLCARNARIERIPQCTSRDCVPRSGRIPGFCHNNSKQRLVSSLLRYGGQASHASRGRNPFHAVHRGRSSSPSTIQSGPSQLCRSAGAHLACFQY